MDLENYIEEWVEALRERRHKALQDTKEVKEANELYASIQNNKDAESIIKRALLRKYYFDRIVKEQHKEWTKITDEIATLSSLLYHWRKKIKPDPVKPEVSRRTIKKEK